jgi:hypothetical protein
MSHHRALIVVAFSVLASTPVAGEILAGFGVERPASPLPGPRSRTAPRHLPLLLIENRGQVDPRVACYAPGRGDSVYFTAGGLTHALTGGGRRWAVKQEFVGARTGARPELRDRRETVFSWFKGPRDRWKTGVPSFGTVAYPELWPGIDMACSAGPDRLKTVFLVKAGADPGRVRFAYRGATSVRVTGSGSLRVDSPAGGFEDEAPVAFQETGGRRIPVETSFDVEPGTGGDGAVLCGFRVGPHDPGLPLQLDPSVNLYEAYFGGAGIDGGYGIAVDGSGSAVVVGSTPSSEASFPVTAGPDLTFNGAGSDAFVARVRADGTGLIYCGYIGGDGEDNARGVAVDSSGSAYVAGGTSSSRATFPLVVGPDIASTGDGGAFVAKVSPDGATLVYCGLIGGDGAAGIAVDPAGNAFVTGGVYSAGPVFPGTLAPAPAHRGNDDAFVAKVRADGTGLAYFLSIGGAGDDWGTGIAVDADGNACIVGVTDSTEATFPVAVGPDLTSNGYYDAFVAKVRGDGTGLAYCGYVGGDGYDFGSGIAVDAAGNAYITGTTWSREDTFPVIVGPDLAFNGSGPDPFVAKVSADGAGLIYCGYIGGDDGSFSYSQWGGGSGIAVDAAGNAHVTGSTNATEAVFPVALGPGLTFTGTYDAFVAGVRADGTGLVSCGYIGRGGYDFGEGIALDTGGNAYVCGESSPSDAMLGDGSQGVFVVKVPSAFPPSPRSLELHLDRGEIRDTFAWWDRVEVSGSFVVDGQPFADGEDPRSGGFVFEVRASDRGLVRLNVPPDDPGWKVRGRGVYAWKGEDGTGPVARVWIDMRTGRFKVALEREAFGVLPTDYFPKVVPVTVYMAVAGASASDTENWGARDWGTTWRNSKALHVLLRLPR